MDNYLPEGYTIKDLVDVDNIADLLEPDCLSEIGDKVVNCFDSDNASRKGWLERYKTSLNLAMQVEEKKSWPWPNAANIKYPLMSLAAITFHARAYPALIPSRDVVNVKSVGRDLLGIKRRRAERVKAHMNYQFLDQMTEWEEDMDRLLLILPITGTEFKKVYFSPSLERNVNKHVFAKDLVVDYYAKNIKTCRLTEILSMTSNEIMENINEGLFRDCEFGETDQPRNDVTTQVSDKIQGLSKPNTNYDVPRMILEQHGYYDLDGDNYSEPYIITVDYATRKVLRIVARFQKESVTINKGQVIKIVPDQYYIKYTFIPSVDGGFYDIGFGHLISPLNKATNTLINQLLDAGTLSNLQSGFIAKSFRQKTGSMELSPGEWKVVNATGNDIRNGILPIPVREPSNVLFQLLQMLIESVQRISSTTDMLVGENPGQNQKATTTQAVVENGMRVFTAIYKRLRRALSEEIRQVYKLNKLYLDDKEYFTILDLESEDLKDLEVSPKDYEDESMDIVPTADPNAVSQLQKMVRAEFLMKMIQFGAPPREVLKRVYDAYEIENPEEVLPPEQQQQQPPLDLMLQDRELSIEEAKVQGDLAIRSREQERKELETAYKLRQGDANIDLNKGKLESDTRQRAMEATMRHIQEDNKVNVKSKTK